MPVLMAKILGTGPQGVPKAAAKRVMLQTNRPIYSESNSGTGNRYHLAVLLFAAGFLSGNANPTYAGCGDYVHWNDGNRGQSAQFLRDGRLLGDIGLSIPGFPKCQGPQCRDRIPLPPNPTPVVPPAPVYDSALWLVAAGSDSCNSTFLEDACRLIRPAGHFLPIEHPPRSVLV
jgi:hypothetical protein